MSPEEFYGRKLTRRIYLIGSLHNAKIPQIAKLLREEGHEVFDDWHAAGPDADKLWRDYETGRGRSYREALGELNATKNFEFDERHLRWANTGILVMPCGRSGHLELGWVLGRGVEGHILLEPDHSTWDLMYRFANGVWFDTDELIAAMAKPVQGG